jgi:hypothetical protein
MSASKVVNSSLESYVLPTVSTLQRNLSETTTQITNKGKHLFC